MDRFRSPFPGSHDSCATCQPLARFAILDRCFSSSPILKLLVNRLTGERPWPRWCTLPSSPLRDRVFLPCSTIRLICIQRRWLIRVHRRRILFLVFVLDKLSCFACVALRCTAGGRRRRLKTQSNMFWSSECSRFVLAPHICLRDQGGGRNLLWIFRFAGGRRNSSILVLLTCRIEDLGN